MLSCNTVQVVISISKLRPADETPTSQETVRLLGEDYREKYSEQQILLSGGQ